MICLWYTVHEWIVCPTHVSRSYSRTNAKMVEPLFRNVKISSHDHPIHHATTINLVCFAKYTKVERSVHYYLNQITKVFMDEGIVKFGFLVLPNLLLFNTKIVALLIHFRNKRN